MKWKIVNDKRAGASWEIGYKEDGNEENVSFQLLLKLRREWAWGE